MLRVGAYVIELHSSSARLFLLRQQRPLIPPLVLCISLWFSLGTWLDVYMAGISDTPLGGFEQKRSDFSTFAYASVENPDNRCQVFWPCDVGFSGGDSIFSDSQNLWLRGQSSMTLLLKPTCLCKLLLYNNYFKQHFDNRVPDSYSMSTLDYRLHTSEIVTLWEIKNLRVAGESGLQEKGSKLLTYPPLKLPRAKISLSTPVPDDKPLDFSPPNGWSTPERSAAWISAVAKSTMSLV